MKELLKVVEINFSIHLNIDLCMIINLQIKQLNEEVILTISQNQMKFVSEYHGLIEKIKNSGNKGFKFDEIVIFFIKFHSSLSNIKTRYYLKLPIQWAIDNFFE